MARKKHEIITCKVDASLLDAMSGIPNRSAFIRNAILAALQSTCPLCGGTGLLSPSQKAHWDQLARTHRLEQCERCHELRLTCTHEDEARPAGRGPGES